MTRRPLPKPPAAGADVNAWTDAVLAHYRAEHPGRGVGDEYPSTVGVLSMALELVLDELAQLRAAVLSPPRRALLERIALERGVNVRRLTPRERALARELVTAGYAARSSNGTGPYVWATESGDRARALVPLVGPPPTRGAP